MEIVASLRPIQVLLFGTFSKKIFFPEYFWSDLGLAESVDDES